jgi:hypothetical protein
MSSFERATQACGSIISGKNTEILIANSDGEGMSEPLVIRHRQKKEQASQKSNEE